MVLPLWEPFDMPDFAFLVMPKVEFNAHKALVVSTAIRIRLQFHVSIGGNENLFLRLFTCTDCRKVLKPDLMSVFLHRGKTEIWRATKWFVSHLVSLNHVDRLIFFMNNVNVLS